jgi:hypothetical protein
MQSMEPTQHLGFAMSVVELGGCVKQQMVRHGRGCLKACGDAVSMALWDDVCDIACYGFWVVIMRCGFNPPDASTGFVLDFGFWMVVCLRACLRLLPISLIWLLVCGYEPGLASGRAVRRSPDPVEEDEY